MENCESSIGNWEWCIWGMIRGVCDIVFGEMFIYALTHVTDTF